MQAQCILFRRYPEVLAPFKYGGYPLLLGAVTLPEDFEESNAAHFLGSEKAPLLEVWCCVLCCHMLCDALWQHSVAAIVFAIRSSCNLRHLLCNETRDSGVMGEVLVPFFVWFIAQGLAGSVSCPE